MEGGPMETHRSCWLVTKLAAITLAAFLWSAEAGIAGASPEGHAHGHAGRDSFGVTETVGSNNAVRHFHDTSAEAATIVDCGSRVLDPDPNAKGVCGLVHYACTTGARLMTAGQRKAQTTTATLGPSHRLVRIDCDIRRAAPLVTGFMARDEAEKLLPHPGIGTAPPGHATLVNIETVLWLGTAADRTLGTVTLLGHRVDLRAHLDQVAWDFGDTTTGVTTGPGKPYTTAEPCRTAACPGYFGHTYVR